MRTAYPVQIKNRESQ